MQYPVDLYNVGLPLVTVLHTVCFHSPRLSVTSVNTVLFFITVHLASAMHGSEQVRLQCLLNDYMIVALTPWGPQKKQGPEIYHPGMGVPVTSHVAALKARASRALSDSLAHLCFFSMFVCHPRR